MKKFDVVTVGNANIDLIFKVPQLPKNDSKVVGKKIIESVGGTVANSACVLGQLGAKVISLSTVGDDHYATKILDDFKRFNVNTQFINIVPNSFPNMAIIFLDNSGEKALVYAPTDESKIEDDDYLHAIQHSKYLYTMPGDLSKFIWMAELARIHQTKIVVDIEPHIADSKEKLNKILSLSNIVIFNLDGFLSCTGKELKVQEIKELVQNYHLDMIIITCGSEGAMVVTTDQYYEHSGFSVEVVDTTGAGDTFNASFVYSLLCNKSIPDSLEFSCACAAMSVGYFGARESIPTTEDVKQFISKSHK